MIYFFSVFFSILLAKSLAFSTSRLVGGNEAAKPHGRYQASLQNLSNYHVCGGAVITEQHVLTVAHCVHNASPEYVYLVVGTNNLQQGPRIPYNVSSIIEHEDYNATSRLNDIAIVKSSGKFDLKLTDILPLYPLELQEGDPLMLTGFGAFEPHGDSSSILYMLNMQVFSQSTCKYAMRYTKEVADTMFCTFQEKGSGTCHGDSGGPILKDNQLAGLISWGIPCAVGFPDVHTRINHYIPWIHDKIIPAK
ncbi:hypothetical protein JYU34_004052 [Plutella xylostella]|uniref:Peptidase S1 domain-containing protein n=1 Tax=Plutella xylostella TaxID=51655 RepID=A0ABQ7QX10_PLUXY|nr:hypothetical protein JYU34_004052 [Plutella xylostella]